MGLDTRDRFRRSYQQKERTMTAIFSAYDSNGLIGRCDSKCHNSKKDICYCICRGAFHGVGTKIAVEDRHTLTDEDILLDLENADNLNTIYLFREPIQMEMFK